MIYIPLIYICTHISNFHLKNEKTDTLQKFSSREAFCFSRKNKKHLKTTEVLSDIEKVMSSEFRKLAHHTRLLT